ncbi:MAG: hypothetical protein WD851_02190 [Pirellulales bacterium]
MKQRPGFRIFASGIALLTGSAVLIAGSASGQVTTETEVVDGVTYQVTRRVVERSMPTTEYQTREEKYYRPQVSTQYQTHQQTYLTPVTQYQLVPRMAGRWNPFVQPYWTYEYAPVTRWEARPTTVQVPLAKTDWVEEKRTLQVPVTTYKTVKEEYISKVAQSVTPSTAPRAFAATQPAASLASQPTTSGWQRSDFGGQQLSNDPPATPPYGNPAPVSERYKR